jgi:iron(III) transport system substrate-binding protein
MSSIKGAKNLENAKKWYDWALAPKRRASARQAKVRTRFPSNKNAHAPPHAPKFS